MLLDALAEIWQFKDNILLLTWSAAEFYWTEIIQDVVFKYGETLTDEQVNVMDWSAKVNYLKRSPVFASRRIGDIFKHSWGKIILTRMHPLTKRNSKLEQLNKICANSYSMCF